MYRQSKQDKIDKDIKKMVLGKTRYHNGTWGIAGYEFKKSKKKVREPLVKFGVSKGQHGSAHLHIDYPDSWSKIFSGKKSSARKHNFRTKTTVRDVTNQKLLR